MMTIDENQKVKFYKMKEQTHIKPGSQYKYGGGTKYLEFPANGRWCTTDQIRADPKTFVTPGALMVNGDVALKMM